MKVRLTLLLFAGPSRALPLCAVDDGDEKVNFFSKKACPAGRNYEAGDVH